MFGPVFRQLWICSVTALGLCSAAIAMEQQPLTQSLVPPHLTAGAAMDGGVTASVSGTGTEIEDERWSAAFGLRGGCSGQILAVATAASGEVFLGGAFVTCATVRANSVIRYDPASDTWSALESGTGQGVNGTVWALTVAGDALYVAGSFDHVNVGTPIEAANIARFDLKTLQWSALASATGQGVDNWVQSLAMDDDGALYVGGRFDHANLGAPIAAEGVARWDPLAQVWSRPAGPGVLPVNIEAAALLWHQGQLYAGTQHGVHVWNAQTGWTRLPAGPGGLILALAATDTDLYAGGDWFEVYPGNNTTIDSGGLARWSFAEERWYGVGAGLERTLHEAPVVRALQIHQGRLIAGGWFFGTGGSEPLQGLGLLAWDLSTETWHTLDGVAGSGTVQVYAIGSLGPDVILGGNFRVAGSSLQWVYTRHVAIWRSASNQWTASAAGEGQPVDDTVVSLESAGDRLYAGGYFSRVGEMNVNSLASWDGLTWDRVGTEQNQGGYEILALHQAHDRLYLTGYFGNESSGPGGVPGLSMASWDPLTGQWNVMGRFESEPPGQSYIQIYALASIGDDVYAAGTFGNVTDEAGTVVASNIARWNRVTGHWSAVGSDGGEGVVGTVRALRAVDGELFVGGNFGLVNSGPAEVIATGIARWDGSAWHPLVSSTGQEGAGSVYALAHDADYLYLGGLFAAVGSGQVPALRVARWRLDGGGWSSLGGGIGQPGFAGNGDNVRALLVAGNWLYASGSFRTAENDSVVVNGIARRHLNGGPWRPLGQGFGSGWASARRMAMLGDDLHVAGSFATAGNRSSFNMASYATRGELDLTINGGGRVSSEPAGLDCSASCSASFEWDQAVTLTAQPVASSEFVGWSGDCSGSGPCVVDFDRARFVGAEFASQADLFANDFE